MKNWKFWRIPGVFIWLLWPQIWHFLKSVKSQRTSSTYVIITICQCLSQKVIFGVKKAQEHENLEIRDKRKKFVPAGKSPFCNFFWLWQFFQVKIYLRWLQIMDLDQLDTKKVPYGRPNMPKMAKFAIPAFRASWRPRGVQSWKKKFANLQFII